MDKEYLAGEQLFRSFLSRALSKTLFATCEALAWGKIESCPAWEAQIYVSSTSEDKEVLVPSHGFPSFQGGLHFDREREQTTTKAKCEGLSTARWTMVLSIAPVEMTRLFGGSIAKAILL